MIDNVKLRMGRISISGEQKGVDLRLGLDLMSMGSTRAVEVAYVISGDDDLTEAVTDAQDLGQQIKVIAVPGADGSPQSVAANLRLAADSTLTIPLDSIRKTVTQVSRPATEQLAKTDGTPVLPPGPEKFRVIPPAPAAPTVIYSSSTTTDSGTEDVTIALDPGIISDVAQATYRVWVQTATDPQRKDLHQSRPSIPPDVDRVLLKDLADRTGLWDIPTWARYQLRQALGSGRLARGRPSIAPRPLRMVSDRLPQGDSDHGIGDSQRDRAVGDHDHHGRCLAGSRRRLLARFTFSMKAAPILGPADVSRIEVSKHRRFPRPRGAVSMRGLPTNRRKSAISDSRSLNSAS